jgi:hypothetical protein
MISRNTIADQEDLKEWWYGLPDEFQLFTIYYGHGRGSTHWYHRESNTTSKDDAWEKLSRLLANASKNGGDFTVLAQDKVTNKSGPRVFVSFDGRRNQISGFPQYQNGSGPPDGYISLSEAKQMAEDKAAIKILQFQLESMEDAIHGRKEPSAMERIIERMAESPSFVPAINAIFTKIAGSGEQRKVAMTGFDEPATVSRDPESEKNESIEGFEYDVDQILSCLEKIRPHFPDPHRFLGRLADYIDQNPELAKSFFDTQTGDND